MSETFFVRIQKDELIFSAAHFITFAGNICERLHGHNYGVAVEIEGPLDENQYVVDFIALRGVLREIVGGLDHYLLLPTRHPQIRVVADAREVTVTFEERRWILPAGDCVLLPVANTTAELLARHIGQETRKLLGERFQFSPQRIRVEVDECQGQLGVYELRA